MASKLRINDPKDHDPLLESAIAILTDSTAPFFDIRPWSTIMPKALADDKKKEYNAARKKAAAKGITKPRHIPSSIKSEDPFGLYAKLHTEKEIDKIAEPVLESAVDEQEPVDSPSFNHMKENIMTTKTKTRMSDEGQSQLAEARLAALVAFTFEGDAIDKAAAKAAKDASKAEAKAAADLAKATAKAEAAAAKAAAKAEKLPRERTYFGSMAVLADHAKSYTKGPNGQLHSNDHVAIALEAVPPKMIVDLISKVMGVPADSYEHLNPGQRSMTLRNKLRGAIKAATVVEIDGVPTTITMDRLEMVRDSMIASQTA